uniref:Cytochrome b6-f complex subunit 6 n=1 Tax=Tetraselmis sp. CCMP 881 TaxID=1812852 RepID=A0A142BY01_9CHLO|nr:subunit VI of cytochrome b6/f complex [Tetraselmis sp. CCMP 881]
MLTVISYIGFLTLAVISTLVIYLGLVKVELI